MRKFTAALSSVALVALSAVPTLASAAPVVLSFEGVTADADQIIPVTPYTESGYTLTNMNPGTFNDGIFGKDASNSNGSATFVFCAYDSTCFSGTSIKLTGGAPFTLKSIDVGNWETGGPAGTLELIGSVLGGGTVMAVLNTGDAWATKLLSGFDNLLSVEFRGHTAYAVAFDNLVLDRSPGRVPEPGSLALAALALAGLGLSARRRIR
ncbi:PEP-CTERM sorting domain-containing protein [Mitsuaria sp. WAJ17]|uniref:PEP-CTERM sorting domain-containing protein n=1 Tax=Mitsuaria sp. WAJ17 TaxID=2761452 RepID=UPI0016018709|nr:PEP-CTERM sorting domain-containing protein [Mitsuaria sp. WAJ17]MBB2487330.1 PEP-CTERM sorting domain-containing protein [Mitsuaria sp. WAJ17]